MAATLAVGRQPSGIDVSPDGRLLLVANRADATVSVLRISGKSVTFVDTVLVDAPVAAVRFTPDGRRALIVFKQDNRVGILQVRSETVTYDPAEDLNVGISPANVDVTPSGDLALVMGSSTDLEASRRDLEERFDSVEHVATTDCGYCMPYENGRAIFLCRGLNTTLQEIWPEARMFI